MQNARALLISVVVAAVAVLLVFSYVQKKEKVLLELSTPVQVAVAIRDIPEGTRFDDSLVQLIEIPKKYVQPGALGSVEEIFDRVASVPLLENTQILEAMLAPTEKAGLAPKIPKDKVGFSIAANKVTGVAGLLQPGDFVDVLTTIEVGEMEAGSMKNQEVITKVVLEYVLVLAVNQRSRRSVQAGAGIPRGGPGTVFKSPTTGRGGDADISTVTLAVAPNDCLKLNMAQEIGSLALALRSTWSGGQPWSVNSLSSYKFLGVDKPVLPRSLPAWVEIRGANQISRY